MRNHRVFYLLILLALVLNACGAKPAMEGGQSDSEYGSVKESGGSGSGSGDTTSFSDENVEKVDEYVVRRGDNLWNISAKGAVYHSGWLYPLILKANRSRIKDPRDLKVGMTLKIPRGLPQGAYDVAREEAMAGTYENEVGPLQEMKTDIPNAPPSASSAAANGKTGGGMKSAWRWLLWAVLLGLAGFGAWKFYKARQNRDESGGEPEPTEKAPE